MPLEHDSLVAEIGTLRNQGLTKLRTLHLPELAEAARQVVDDDTLETPVVVEQLLRRAIEGLGGGDYGDAAARLFGLEGGLRGSGPRERREAAADALDRMSAETFRTRHQKTMVSNVADQVLALVGDQDMRTAHQDLSRRHPAESRLAVQWVERFEAYYRIWTPVFGLGAELTAFRSTMLEEDRPYGHAVEADPRGEPYTQERQAEGYAQYAIYQYAKFEWQLRQFMTRYGGLWLLSDGATETAVADAVYDISWHVTPFNERDASYLRSIIQDTRAQELHGFLQTLARTDIGHGTYTEWLDWLQSCECRWPIGESSEAEYFPTWHDYSEIVEGCQVHRVIEACGMFCDLIDRDWRKIADWYHLGEPTQRGRSPEERYAVRRAR